MPDILITGGAGSFGRQLALVLREKGYSLKIFDLPSCDYSFFKDWENTIVCPGDILDAASLNRALDGVDQVFHLAAVLPPVSEVDREKTFKVNVEGTRILLEVCKKLSKVPSIVFTSSVSVYGDTSRETNLISPVRPPNPNDWYAESKVEAEKILFSSGIAYVNLRISGVVIPAFLDPPEPWAFQQDQKIELVCLGDLTRAMAALAGNTAALDKTLIISGGKSWQITGEAYVKRWGEIMEIPLDEMTFLERSGWLSWYDTEVSQRLLGYQQTSLDDFYNELDVAVKAALA